MPEPLRLVLVQPLTDDPKPILDALRQAGYVPDWRHVATEHEFQAALKPPPDLILADYHLPGWCGLAALDRLQERGLAVPLIFVSSTHGEEPAVAAMKHGAADYLLRDQLRHLGPRVREALAGGPNACTVHRRAAAANDTTRRQQAEENHARLAAILEATPDLVVTADPNGQILYLNAAARKLLGLAEEAPLEKYHIQDFHSSEAQDLLARVAIPTALRQGVWSGENVLRHAGGRDIPVWQVILAHKSPAGVKLLSTVARDLTDYKRLERQYRQAQKMEAVGRLAGGVAHDFNNLLTVIKGFTELLLRPLSPSAPQRVYLEQIFRAGESATMLTRQLLAFSRKQMLKPEVFSLNALVVSAEKMLRRLIGEHIELKTALASDLRTVKADPGQCEQVVMNLVVNASDAMQGGGTLLIETSNRELGQEWIALHPEMPPGSYVVLAISDTGCGMNQETLCHLFEPFFTTKEAGKGTGLGLATVYGIVKQSGGFVYASSVVGQGSRFEVFLPAAPPEIAPVTPSAGLNWINPRGTETILLVEDQVDVRRLAREALEISGYKILEASDPATAVQVFEQHQHAIQVLVTDVVMPGMSGCELAERLTLRQPRLKVLYMSGYTDEAMLRHGVSTNAFNMLLKPFTPSKLTRKVREILDQ